MSNDETYTPPWKRSVETYTPPWKRSVETCNPLWGRTGVSSGKASAPVKTNERSNL